ncbi:MAG: hypothetical protein MRY57_00240 [Candidatus Pacebacteria bacterium]|nr:hypothetical protein [Candidatus Paceibacterota bacterium]
MKLKFKDVTKFLKGKYQEVAELIPSTEEIEKALKSIPDFLEDRGVLRWFRRLDKEARAKVKSAFSDRSARRILLILLSLAIPTKLFYRILLGIVDIEDVKLVNTNEKSISITLLDQRAVSFNRSEEGVWTCAFGPNGRQRTIPLPEGIDKILANFKVKAPWKSSNETDSTEEG